MSRNRAKGSSFEQQVVDYMRNRLDDPRIERRVSNGANDRGDVSGLSILGKRAVLECKNHARMELSRWVEEAETEKGNDGAEWAFVVHKRKGCGEKRMGETYVTMTLETLCALAAGSHWNLNFSAEERESPRYMVRERGIDEEG